MTVLIRAIFFQELLMSIPNRAKEKYIKLHKQRILLKRSSLPLAKKGEKIFLFQFGVG